MALTMDTLRQAQRRVNDIMGYQPGVFGGLRVIVSPHVPREHLYDAIGLIPLSRYRSRRIFKKLAKRRRLTARRVEGDFMSFRMGDSIVVHPSHYDALRRWP